MRFSRHAAGEDMVRLREELAGQLHELAELVKMGELCGFESDHPASDAREAVQWTYMSHLVASRQANGAAIAIGRTSVFLDLLIQGDIRERRRESEAQKFRDQLVQKLRIIRFFHAPKHDPPFGGDLHWATVEYEKTNATPGETGWIVDYRA